MRIWVIENEAERSFSRPELSLHSQWRLSAKSLQEFAQTIDAKTVAADLVVLFQDRPKQISQGLVMRGLQAAPLLRMVRVLGPWCDGDLRTPGRLLGLYTLSFRESTWRLTRLIEDFRVGRGVLTQPLTTLQEACEHRGAAAESLRVGVALSGRLAEGAAANIRALGHLPVLPEDLEDQVVDVVLMDGDELQEGTQPTARFDCPALFLEGFSRAGAREALAKTYSLCELDAALQKLTAAVKAPAIRTSR